MSNKPRPYDLTQPAEVSRLFHETIGYMHTSLHWATDIAGRRYALIALQQYLTEWINGSAPTANGAIAPRPDTCGHRAIAELVEAAQWVAENYEPQDSDPVRRVRAAIAGIERISTEIERERAAQAMRVMDHIGPLVDAWCQVPNDLSGDLAYASPSFVKAMNAVIRAVGSDIK